jgi:threonylcarbamoyladenosine tRNA methylthiotransferase MtaB
VVTGCLATLDPDAMRALGERVVVEPDKDAVPARVRELAGDLVAAGGACDTRPARARAQLKVQDGCDAFCAYCIVPYARGVPRAVPADRVLAEAARLVAAGVSEIVLTGINIGRYDDDGLRLPGLIERVATTGVGRIRLSSIEPNDVDDALLEVAARTPAFCGHLHVPLQSGADTMLVRMGRPYDTVAYAAAVGRARAALPGMALSTDVIVGLPGETDADFAQTLRFAEEMAFSRLHVFRYSARPGTPAAAMDGQVAPEVRTARSAALRELGDRLAASFAQTQLGRTVEVLVERTADDGTAEGITREYVRARVPRATVPSGALVSVIAERIEAGPVLVGRSLV